MPHWLSPVLLATPASSTGTRPRHPGPQQIMGAELCQRPCPTHPQSRMGWGGRMGLAGWSQAKLLPATRQKGQPQTGVGPHPARPGVKQPHPFLLPRQVASMVPLWKLRPELSDNTCLHLETGQGKILKILSPRLQHRGCVAQTRSVPLCPESRLPHRAAWEGRGSSVSTAET